MNAQERVYLWDVPPPEVMSVFLIDPDLAFFTLAKPKVLSRKN